jgi:hypothetical protein
VLGVDIDNDPRLVDQYNKLFAAAPVLAPAVQGEKTIKLFDE